MIRAVVAALFPQGERPSWVPGLGLVVLPGAVRDRRHGCHRIERRPLPSNGKVSDLSGQVRP